MALESLRHVVVLPVSPERLYAAWIDADAHGELTGGAATSDPRVGGVHSAWDGYITGTHIELVPGERIVQSWRSTEFPQDAADSHLEIHLRAVPGGTEVTLIHTDIPGGQAQRYEAGWIDHYFDPMRKYFGAAAKASATPKKSTKKLAAKSTKKPAARAAKRPAAKSTKKPAARAAKRPAARAAKKPAKAKPKIAKKKRR